MTSSTALGESCQQHAGSPCHPVNCRLSLYQPTEGDQGESNLALIFIPRRADKGTTTSCRLNVNEANQPISPAHIYAAPLLPVLPPFPISRSD